MSAAMCAGYRLYRDDDLVLELQDEPGILISTSAPPPLPGQGPVTHPFATATFHTPETEGELGTMLRGAPDLDAFLEAARSAGYRVEEVVEPVEGRGGLGDRGGLEEEVAPSSAPGDGPGAPEVPGAPGS